MNDKIEKSDSPAGPLGPVEDTSWIPDFKKAVFFLAGVYAAEQIQKEQRWAQDGGRNLSAEKIAKIFAECSEYMTNKIQNTTQTGSIIDCPVCSKGYVYHGPGRKVGDWHLCSKCDGTGKVTR